MKKKNAFHPLYPWFARLAEFGEPELLKINFQNVSIDSRFFIYGENQATLLGTSPQGLACRYPCSPLPGSRLHPTIVLPSTFSSERRISRTTSTETQMRLENRTLKVGEELYKETLPLKMGSRVYQLQGLKPYSWYEVKISYPASIPSSFTLKLTKGGSDLGTNHHRKLLNTEKLIFQTESLDLINNQGGTHVLVSVEAEGIVAIPGVKERETVIFNIVCDELFLGLPHKVWPVVILAVLCLALGFILPLYFRLPFPVQGESQEQHQLKHR